MLSFVFQKSNYHNVCNYVLGSDTSLNGTWSNQVSENTTQNPFKSDVYGK